MNEKAAAALGGDQAGDGAVKGEGATKPHVQLSGEDGNVFFIIGRVGRALKKAGLTEQADEFYRRARACGSYDKVLALVGEYCEIA